MPKDLALRCASCTLAKYSFYRTYTQNIPTQGLTVTKIALTQNPKPRAARLSSLGVA